MTSHGRNPSDRVSLNDGCATELISINGGIQFWRGTPDAAMTFPRLDPWSLGNPNASRRSITKSTAAFQGKCCRRSALLI